MAKPDDRSDNVERLQHAIANTMENMREAKDYLKAHGEEMRPEDKAAMEEKNARREEAIHGFRAEIQDEAHRQ
ncbi:MAG: small acid-soluble spore protein Tlp [Alicyclobacillus sp.]|nr:small acid-soluble spore protein Tlp [Alicyclobacillus sp.]